MDLCLQKTRKTRRSPGGTTEGPVLGPAPFVFRRERSVKASRTGPTNSTRRKTGRPLGSVTLTEQIVDTIVSYVRAGAFDHVAAEAAGISARTFRDWMARGEGRGSRASSRKLRAFAERVREAQAEARAGAEIRVFQE